MSADPNMAHSRVPRHRPLLAAQLGVWFGGVSADPSGSTFNVGDYLTFDGQVRPDVLEAAHQILTGETEIARLCFAEGEGGPVQVLRETPDWLLRHIDFSDRPDPVRAALSWMEADMAIATNLLTTPLLTAALLKITDGRYFYYRRAHHIVLDGWSLNLLARRLADLYSDLSLGRPPSPSPFRSIDVLLSEEASYHDSDRFRRDEQFWMTKLQGVDELTTLAFNPAPGPRGVQRIKRDLDSAHIARMRQAATALGVSWAELMLTISAAYVMRITGATDFILDMAISARTTKAQRSVPCMAANIVPLRLRCPGSVTWEKLAHNVRAEVHEATMHSRYRSEDMVRKLGLVGRGQLIHGPAINVMAFDQELRFAGVPARRRSVQGIGVDDIAFTFWQASADSLELIVDANPRLYSGEETAAHLGRLADFINGAVTAAPGTKVADVDFVGPAERATLLAWGTGAASHAQAGLAPDLFHRQTEVSPDSPAIEFQGVTTTYRELNRAANRLARLLIRSGIGPGAIVALALPRSTGLVTAMLAVIKTGAAYLPLDLSYPPARLAYMVADAKPTVLLTSGTTAAGFQGIDQMLLDDPALAGALATSADSDLHDSERIRPLTPDHGAYVIYTSGSTGSPKGVIVPHRGLGYLRGLALDSFALRPSSRVLQFVSPSFDMSVADVWMTLLTGGTLVLAPREQIQPGPDLERFLAESAISHVFFPTSTLQVLTPEQVPREITFVIGAEMCGAQVTADWSAKGWRLIHGYGPTETTVYCTATKVLTPAQVGAPPIGVPLPGSRMYVLDTDLRLVPAGVSGELYIAGAGVALGYLGQPALTATRFVPDPYGPPGSRMYRSGDIVRWAPDGQLEFLRRNDDQVKVRGFRIELGEVEAVLMRQPGVARAAVVVREDRPGDRRLVAYAQPAAGTCLDPAALRMHLGEQLPEYMIPLVTILDELPLTPSGKIARAALPPPATAAAGAGREAQTSTEKQICVLFADVLGIPPPGVDDNFFELGGDSLSAVRLLKRISVALGVRPTMRQLFATPTVAGLAQFAE